MNWRAPIVTLLICLSLIAPRAALARPPKPSAQQLAQAKAAFGEGTVAYDAGHYEDALHAFERAHELSRNPILFFNMAACTEKLGQLRVAVTYLRTYLSEVPQADDADKVRERIGGLEARAQQIEDQQAEDQRRLEEEARRPKEPPPPVAVVVQTPPLVEHESTGRRYAGGFAALGATAVFGVVAAGLGGSAVVKYNNLDSSCGAVGCGSRVDSVRNQAIAADAFIGLTGAAAVTTVILFALEARHHTGSR
jgi:tetratricopeptide (TPR) repeat protein